MKHNEIVEILNLFDGSSITDLNIEKEGFKISAQKNTVQTISEQVCYDNQPIVSESKKAIEIKEEEDEGCFEVKSPMVGTVYLAPSPDENDFIKKGQVVKNGDTLVIIEAMKIMNEIQTEVEGEIVEICVNNEDAIEYGQVLVKIKA